MIQNEINRELELTLKELDNSVLRNKKGFMEDFKQSLEKGLINKIHEYMLAEDFEKDCIDPNPLLLNLTLGFNELAIELLNMDVNPNIHPDNYPSALRIALGKRAFNLAEAMIQKGCEINERDSKGWTPLITFAFNGHKEAVEFLLKHNACVNVCNNDGWNAVVGAYAQGHMNIVELLMGKGAEFGEKYVQAAMLSAFKKGKYSIVRELIKKEVNPNFYIDNKNKLTFLSLVMDKNEWDLIIDLISCGADPNACNSNGGTVVDQAARYGMMQLLELAIKKGGNLNRKDGMTSPLHLACEGNHLNCVKLLIENGAFIDSIDKNDKTPLYIALVKKNIAIAKYLLNEGASSAGLFGLYGPDIPSEIKKIIEGRRLNGI